MPARAAVLAFALGAAPLLPEGPPVVVREPAVAAELRTFAPAPPAWSAGIANAIYGEGVIGQKERRAGWLASPEHAAWIDAVERAHNLSNHRWLERRGIRADFYGYNEYQETIHLDSAAALEQLGERGLARGPFGELVIDPHHSRTVASWRGRPDAYIADPLEPRWAAILRHDLLTSPLFADALSQDNLGGVLTRIGPSALGRFGNAATRGFAAWQRARDAPSEPPVRAYLRERFGEELLRLPPYAEPRAPAFEATSSAAQALCADPVLAEYQIFLHAAHLHAFSRLYTDLRRVAARAGRDFDVHGNLGGGVVGAEAYPIALGRLGDAVFFETPGLAHYDQIEHGWWNALGALRLGLAHALARQQKPAYFLVGPRERTPDLLALELGEVSAGGGVPLVNPDLLARASPELLATAEGFLRLRAERRERYAPRGRARVADVALLYSIPTFLFDPCLPGASSSGAPPLSNLSGAARALEEAHVPHDVVVLGHGELAGEEWPAAQLAGRRVLIAPSVENLSDAQLAGLERHLRAGGALAVLGRLGVRDERNRDRVGDALARLRAAGEVRVLLGGESFPQARAPEDERVRAQARRLAAELAALTGPPSVSGELPRTLWLRLWSHPGGALSAHFVNYDFERGSRRARPTAPVALRLRLPAGVRAERASWLVPGAAARELTFRVRDAALDLELPSVAVYGVLELGPRTGSAPAKPRPTADDAAYRAEIAKLGAYGDPVLALDFGETTPRRPWQPLAPDTAYRPERGYGWLESDDDSLPSLEESAYVDARSVDAQGLRNVSLVDPYWPYREEDLARPLRRALLSGRAQRLRLDLADGLYRVSVVSVNGAWNQRNQLVSGMVFADGRPVLLDIALDRGGMTRRAFTTRVSGGTLELRFGGATGFGVAALVVERARADEVDPLAVHGVREFRISPRHANPDWADLADIVVPAESARTVVRAAPEGLPLVDLGTLAQARVGDVVVARARVAAPRKREAVLRVGASSAAHVYLNDQRVLVVPGVKGVERDEGRARVQLRAGENELVIVLERFFERRWLFYASVE